MEYFCLTEVGCGWLSRTLPRGTGTGVNPGCAAHFGVTYQPLFPYL